MSGSYRGGGSPAGLSVAGPLPLRGWGHEGLVWHHPDGRMAKIEARDFPSEA
ncbi:hypothetical protein GCM10009530_48340 [Microbispora corallina]|uniref:Uncharacterized protein n=1 Tax=Microbispora corallina TaxID=83302 RepID=A0ABQ4G5W5_9ACTN|nr:hypothetical protein Mco01_54100 [Microbispora corallina]